MSTVTPLDPPRDAGLLSRYLSHFGITAAAPPRDVLSAVAATFAFIPYENLTKIIRVHESGRAEEARRSPEEVLSGHFAHGTGGTCFSLTAALLHLVRALGFPAEPILADRRYGPDTHSALLVWIDARPHLLDPGYLIVDPIPVKSGEETEIRNPVRSLILTPDAEGRGLELHSADGERRVYRHTYKSQPVDPDRFLAVWDCSFDWEMMRYPLLTRMDAELQLYLRGNYFQRRGSDGSERAEIPPGQLPARITAEFAIDPSVVARALSILKAQGEPYG